MGKRATIAGIVFGIIGVVSSIMFISITMDINNQQQQQELNNNVIAAKQNLDSAIRHDVQNCLANPSTQCDNELSLALENCKKQDEKDIPACTDNTIPSYFSIRGSASNDISSTPTSSSNQIQVTRDNTIDNCTNSPSEICNNQMADLYQKCSTAPAQLSQCNPKVVQYLIRNAVILDSSGKVVFYQKGSTASDGSIISRGFLVASENMAYYNDEPSHDPRLLYQKLNPSYVHPTWDVNTAGLNVLAFCQGSTSPSCDESMVALSGFCYDQPAIFPVCGDERISEYLIKQNLTDKIIKQPY